MVAATGGALISPDGVYRYDLWRRWAPGPALTFVMLNPSTADADVNDPTIRKCIGFATRLGYGGISVVNLFAARATNPKDLSTFADPIGPLNDMHMARVFRAQPFSTIVVSWGASKVRGDLIPKRIAAVLRSMSLFEIKPLCLGRSKDGQPRHPLMLAYSTALESYEGQQ